MLVAGAQPDDAPRLHAGCPVEPPLPLRPLLAILHWIRYRERLRFLAGVPPGGNVFEVGAGDGRLVKALGAAGYRASGAEPYRAPGSEVRDLDIVRAPVAELDLPAGSQDAVVLWHVLEHLEDPAAALRQIRGWLDEDGCLVVAVPNLRSLQAHIGGDRWFQLDLPRHRVQFTPEGIGRLLERVGFREIHVSQLVVEQSVVAMWQTLLNRVTSTPDAGYALVKRRATLRLGRDVAVTAVAGAALLPVAAALELGATMFGRGGSIVARARAR